MSISRSILWFLLLITLSGCEVARTIIGTSTRKLEYALPEAISRTFVCEYEDCYSAILALDRNNVEREAKTDKYFDVFMKDRIKGQIVVMGVPGQVDTTEVGIFLTAEGPGAVRVDVTSLATQAKEKVADAVFTELATVFVTPPK